MYPMAPAILQTNNKKKPQSSQNDNDRLCIIFWPLFLGLVAERLSKKNEFLTKFSSQKIKDKNTRWLQAKSGKRGLAVVVFLETFDLFDVVDVVLDFLELGKGFGWDDVAQVFLELHGEFDSIKRIKAMISKGTFPGDAWNNKKNTIFVGGAEIVLNGFDDVGFNVLFFF